MARITLTRPTTFLSALAIAVISTIIACIIVWFTLIFWGEMGTAYVDVILLWTLVIAAGISSVVLWGFATKRLGYVWA